MKLAIVGVTGMVGNVILKVLEEKKIILSNLIPVASKKSFGKEIKFNGKSYKIVDIEEALEQKPHRSPTVRRSEPSNQLKQQGCIFS